MNIAILAVWLAVHSMGNYGSSCYQESFGVGRVNDFRQCVPDDFEYTSAASAIPDGPPMEKDWFADGPMSRWKKACESLKGTLNSDGACQFWTCADKSRILLTADNGKKWCLSAQQ